MIPITSYHSLLLSYNDIENMYKNKHNSTNFLVYGFYLTNRFENNQIEIQKPNWYQVQRSGKTYSPMRIHLPKQKTGYLSTGTLIYDVDLKLFKDKEDAEVYLELYTLSQREHSHKLQEYFNKAIDYLEGFKLP